MAAMCAHLPSMLMIGKYFENRRGMANGIANVGGSLGGFVLPFLLTFLLEEYGLEDTLILSGGLFLQFLPAGLVMRPIDRGQQGGNVKEVEDCESEDKDEESEKRLMSMIEKDHKEIAEYDIQKIHVCNGSSNSIHETGEKDRKLDTSLKIQSHHRSRPLRSVELFGSSMDVGSMVSIENIAPVSSSHGRSLTPLPNKNRNCCVQFLLTLFNFSLFKNPNFILLMCVAFLMAPGSSIVVTYIAPLAKDTGQSTKMIGYLLTLSAAGDLAGRFLFVFISDNKLIQRRHMLTIASLANGLACLLVPFYDTFAELAVFGFLQASLGGTYWSLINVIIVDFLGLDNLRHGLSMSTVVRGLTVAITSACVGKYKSFHIPGHLQIMKDYILLSSQSF